MPEREYLIVWSENIIDDALLDQGSFISALNSETLSATIYKDQIQNTNQYLIEGFDDNKPIKDLLYKRAWFIDQLLIHAWQQHIISNDLALVAVGGYGRRELHPCSDIDILVLTKPRIKSELKKQIESFLVFLWDIGLEVGASVRTVRESQQVAKSDITIITNLMESRCIIGESRLYEEMCKLTRPNKIWLIGKFFEVKLAEQITRHKKYGETEYKLEPNLKEGSGGLRDIQVVDWVAKRHFGAKRLSELKDYGFLTKNEYDSLNEGRAFLWRARFALHILTSRREDRLLFDYQRSVAKTFGYESEDNSAVELFMKKYYKTVRELNRLNEMLLQYFQEAIIYAKRKEKIVTLNKRFQIRNNFIEVTNKNIFKRYPIAMLELFLLIQQNPSINGVRASTIRLMRESMPLIDDKYRDDIRNKSLFLEIIKQPRMVGHELKRMHRYGMLATYMPEFARIEDLMQFDLFHIYTVDEHILLVVQNLRHFAAQEYVDKFPLCRDILSSIPKQELLYLAGIFHDIAKGRGGHHSELGAELALTFCRRHQLSDFDAKLVSWLVTNHLFMSRTAQRKDINDPEVINQFAKSVGDIMHLQYLYLLTVADICGTNPQMWSNWKRSLIAELYKKTLRNLHRGLENPIDKTERIEEVKNVSRNIIRRESIDSTLIDSFWSAVGDDYFIRYTPEEIAWQTQLIINSKESKSPLIGVKQKMMSGGTGIFIYVQDHDSIFSNITIALDNLGLNIVDARLITSKGNYTLDTFIVIEESGEAVESCSRIKEVKDLLTKVLTSLDKPVKKISRIDPRKLRNFSIPTQVHFSQDENNSRTIMEVIATDRIGFLSRIGSAMEICGASLQGAKIATYGEKVEDIFFITNREQNMITSESKLAKLENTIIELLDDY